jgi:hypothetical protein
VGGREKFWGKEEVEKTLIISGRENVFFVHPQNGLNGLILNWGIAGCWFTPAVDRAYIILEFTCTISLSLELI